MKSSFARFLLPVLTIPGMAASPLTAADDVSESVANAARVTGGLAKTAGKSRGELTDIAADATLNQLAEPQAGPMETFARRLQQIQENQFARLMESYKSADATQGDSMRRNALVETFTRQKTLELALEEAAADFSPGEAQLRLVRHLSLLLGRQMKNLRQTTELAGSAIEPGTSTERRHLVAGVEQAAIRQEIDLLARVTERRPADWPADQPVPMVLPVKEGIRRSGLPATAERATEWTRNGPLQGAVAAQKEMVQKLTALLEATLDDAPPELIAADAKKILAGIVADERGLRAATTAATTDNPTLAERQKRIAERTEVLQRLLARLSPEAAAIAGQAKGKMGKAANGLAPGTTPGGAVPAESDAIALLEKAAGMLPGPGPGEMPGNMRGNMPGFADDGSGGNGYGGNENLYEDSAKPTAKVMGELVAKEREALADPDQEGSLPEYSTMVEQYLRSLSDSPPAQ